MRYNLWTPHKEQTPSFLPPSPSTGAHQGFCPCPPPHTIATQVLLGSPHHTGLSLGPHLTQLPLLEDSICSCLFSLCGGVCVCTRVPVKGLFLFVESYLCWVWDLQEQVKQMWSGAQLSDERRRSRLLNAIPIVNKYNAEMDGALIIYQTLCVPLTKQVLPRPDLQRRTQ